MILNYKRLLVLQVNVLLSIVLLSCRDEHNPVTPPTIKDPRIFSWSVDTLSYPGSFQTAMSAIWGSSSSDVYVVGHNDQNRGLMWHFNGNSWTSVKLAASEGGYILGAMDLSNIFGFASDDIYAVGELLHMSPVPIPGQSSLIDSSLIIHFNGTKWEDINILKSRRLNCISGNSSHFAFAGGWGKNYYTYNGFIWTRDSINIFIPSDGFFQIYSLAVMPSGETYALAKTNQQSLVRDTYYFLKYYSNHWTVIDTAIIDPTQQQYKWGYSRIWLSPWGNLYSLGKGLYLLSGSTWIKVKDADSWFTGIYGTSEISYFVTGGYGTVLHYNGSDYFQYMQFKNLDVSLNDVWTDGKEVFTLGRASSSPEVTIVLHGK
jgi:hypothetical protein